MHEMGIANSVLDAVRAETRRFPGGHIYAVGVRIGELAGVSADALSVCSEALVPRKLSDRAGWRQSLFVLAPTRGSVILITSKA